MKTNNNTVLTISALIAILTTKNIAFSYKDNCVSYHNESKTLFKFNFEAKTFEVRIVGKPRLVHTFSGEMNMAEAIKAYKSIR